jgi:Fe-S cluster assembly iron-binding protein IscA
LIEQRMFGSVAYSLHKERKRMLTLTETATTVVKTIVDQDPNVTDGALRIGTAPGRDREFQIAVVGEAQPGDTVVETDGARVLVSESAVPALEDKTLDAQVSENGAVTFALVPQAS